jgi:hypothetical protein
MSRDLHWLTLGLMLKLAEFALKFQRGGLGHCLLPEMIHSK